MKKTFMLTCFCLAFALSGYSRAAASCNTYTNTNSTAIDSLAEEEKIYTFEEIDEQPSFLGGDLPKLLTKEIQYPESAIKNDISGRVYMQFVVEKDGSVKHVWILRGDSVLSQEVVRAFNLVNQKYKWTPAKIKGQPVRCEMSFPVLFRFQNPQSQIEKAIENLDLSK